MVPIFVLGNSYGCQLKVQTGIKECCTGCGNQEQFYACSDVRIVPADHVFTTTTTHTPPTSTTTTAPIPEGDVCYPRNEYRDTHGMDVWCERNCPSTPGCIGICICPGDMMPDPADPIGEKPEPCVANHKYDKNVHIHKWCEDLCPGAVGCREACMCPGDPTHPPTTTTTTTTTTTRPTTTKKTKKCVPKKMWRQAEGMAAWCRSNCDIPAQCKSRCICRRVG